MTANATLPRGRSAGLVRRMTRLAEQNMSAEQIADALGLTRDQVLGKMDHLGLSSGARKPAKRSRDIDVKKLTELVDRGLTANRIGEALGLSSHQVTYRMRKLGLKLQPNTEWPAGATEKLAALADQGLSNAGIAKALGLTRGQVLGKMYRLGLKTKNAPTSRNVRSRTRAPMDAAL